MIKNTTLAAVFAVAVSLFVPAVAAAQEADPVVVRVDGYEIRVSEVSLAAESITTQISELPPQARYPFVVQYLIERHLLAAEAKRQNIEQEAEYKRLMAYYQAKAARDAFFVTKISPTVTEDSVRAEYDKQSSAVDNQEKTHLRLILVDDEKLAQDIHKQLTEGADFAELANEHTAAQTAKNGGDLGWFTKDEMAPEIAAATTGLKVGEISKPYKTDFGWSIIKVQEKTVVKAQPFDQIKNGLMMLMARQKVQDLVNTLTEKAKIEVVDPDLKKLQEMKAQQQQ